jgi:hypothetical protein
MATCASCRSEVAEKDFFCWSCGKPWKGCAAQGTLEEQVYDEYAQKMREEYVQDRKVRALTLAAVAVAALFGLAVALMAGGPYTWFYVGALGLAALFATVRAVVNWKLHASAKAKLAAERGS